MKDIDSTYIQNELIKLDRKIRISMDRETQLKYIEKDTIKKCKMLYNTKNNSQYTIGWEFADGWNDIVREMSINLEMLNLLYYPKYHTYIRMAQCKEKFGYLTCYYDIIQEKESLIKKTLKPFNNISQNELDVVKEYLDNAARKIINEATDKCYNVCELCGIPIGTSTSKRVCTKGWITYICEKCNIARTINLINTELSSIQKSYPDEYKTSLYNTLIEYIEKYNQLKQSNKYIKNSEYHSLNDELMKVCKQYLFEVKKWKKEK